jgi:deoxyribodipyrimidine photo-lyase
MTQPVLLWVRRDLRLADNPALMAALAHGAPVIAVFIHDETLADLGAAPSWRFGLGIERFAETLSGLGSKLILRRGKAVDVLADLVSETNAQAVHWTRAYDPAAIERDTKVKATLKARGVTAKSHAGHLLFEPWTVNTKTGGFFKVYTPMWKSVKDREVSRPLPAPSHIPAPSKWPASEHVSDWGMGDAMRRGANVVSQHIAVGESAARDRLDDFIDGPIARYKTDRDIPGKPGTSRLSENLTYGEIGARTCWHAGMAALQQGADDAEVFLKELVWREFAYHLLFHTPHILTGNWRTDWDTFPWNTQDTDHVEAWKQGRTGIPFVDAAMREMYVTGTMHNRGRMIVASYLTKHLMTHWQIGLKWFEDCLIDWDPASNAMGWQWAAGSGPDAAPYFRVFNPVTQLEKFDPDQAYQTAWIAEGRGAPSATALSYFKAIPKSWNLTPDAAYPTPIVTPEMGRKAALDAYSNRGF